MTVGLLAISTAAIFIKLCHDAPPVVIAAARLLVATSALAVGGAARRGTLLAVPAGHGKYVVLSGLFLAAHFLFWVSSLKLTSVLSSVVLVTINPLFVSVASFFLFKEPMHRGLIAGLALAGVGVGLISWSDAGAAPASLYGNLLALGGAVMASAYFLVGRKLRREMGILSYSFTVNGVAALLLGGLTLLQGHPLAGYAGRTYLCLVLLGLVPQLLGHGSLNWALRHVSATTVSVFILAEPIGASLFAYFVLGESISTAQGVGGGLILAGIVIAARDASTGSGK